MVCTLVAEYSLPRWRILRCIDGKSGRVLVSGEYGMYCGGGVQPTVPRWRILRCIDGKSGRVLVPGEYGMYCGGGVQPT